MFFIPAAHTEPSSAVRVNHQGGRVLVNTYLVLIFILISLCLCPKYIVSSAMESHLQVPEGPSSFKIVHIVCVFLTSFCFVWLGSC